jgi:hypothetical protein
VPCDDADIDMNNAAVKSRDTLAAPMSATQIIEAKKRAQAWMPS